MIIFTITRAMNIFETLLLQPLASGLIIFYRLMGNNMGLAIIGFTVFLKIVLNPLTKPYMESMKKMKDLSPALNKIKERHKGDKVKLAQAQAELYKQNKVNPGSGCLPYLLQIVILIAFFNVFSRTLYQNVDTVESFNKLVYPGLRIINGEGINTKFLYMDIKTPDTINIPGLPFSIPGPLLIAAALIQFLSAKISAPFVKEEEKIAKKTKSDVDDMQVAMQKNMIYMFPLMTLVIGYQFPSGLALYWLMFSLTQTVQQVMSQGWGGLSPFVKRIGLVKS
ncbi:MAG: Membrane protein insertase, YidC/Oxa1 family [Candidatus Woesebacteria bacterium GW2011_GWC1_38_13]|uniref:Membrane protein insertase, YidC/Oxa1 family n=4 Tax=Candidatus Woeseibacteriota TaxID=1752722 RepID=A0A0G0KYB3_9BACT|nr:MAG: Membrane protein insertase, YidC/Oxa1 family [Candidatus Woesebacteria bacterium GW2011_GWC1_38_13]KKQ84643.1 MAG: Membrane protein insertase, YidC/Oxa1 family [Candidatus Woesebacteria bacterium GW2011_GWA1_38_8]